MDKEKTTLTTDEILKRLDQNEPVSKEEIDFVTPRQLKDLLHYDITKNSKYSINQIATECNITPSHLSDFLNDKKNMNRDKILSLLIVLGYDITKTRQFLTGLGYNGLYARNVRDFIILNGIKDKLPLDKINEKLKEGFEDSLC